MTKTIWYCILQITDTIREGDRLLETGGLNTRRKLVTVVLFVIVSMMILALVSFPGNGSGSASPGTQAPNSAMNSQQTVQPDMILVNSMETFAKQCAQAGNTVFKFFGGLRHAINTVILIPYILCFTWISVFAYHQFNRKTHKPLPIIAIPIGGNAPPFSPSEYAASKAC